MDISIIFTAIYTPRTADIRRTYVTVCRPEIFRPIKKADREKKKPPAALCAATRAVRTACAAAEGRNFSVPERGLERKKTKLTKTKSVTES
jgi:hypothetical protein